jgi:hypothetical protein
LARLADILGPEFRANAVEVRAGREGLMIEGFAALPTLTRANSLGQYLFVNGRPVRDKLLLGVLRGAYADYLPRDADKLWFLVLLGGLAHVTKPIAQLTINLLTGWPFGSFRYGVAYPFASHLLFGMIGGLVGALIVLGIQRASSKSS